MTTIFLSTVTDHALLVSQAVKLILFVLLIFGVGFNMFKAWKENYTNKKIIRGCIATVLFVVAIPIFRWIQIEGSLLSSNEYTIGTTIRSCEVFAKGKGVEFEYKVAGKEYNNCNTYHPISIENIVIPDGKYYVRFSIKYPERGRIDFNKPVR